MSFQYRNRQYWILLSLTIVGGVAFTLDVVAETLPPIREVGLKSYARLPANVKGAMFVHNSDHGALCLFGVDWKGGILVKDDFRC